MAFKMTSPLLKRKFKKKTKVVNGKTYDKENKTKTTTTDYSGMSTEELMRIKTEKGL